MAISVNWPTGVIFIPRSFLTSRGNNLYELDVNQLRIALKDLEDNEEGSVWPDTHIHNTQVTLSGVTYARTFQILSPYTVTFEDVGSPYRVSCVGANHNISDVQNLNNVSIIVGNSAGLITVSTGSGLSIQEHDKLMGLEESLTVAEHDKLMSISPTGLTTEEHNQLMGLTNDGGLTTQEHDKLMGLPDTSGGLTITEHDQLMSLVNGLLPGQEAKLDAIFKAHYNRRRRDLLTKIITIFADDGVTPYAQFDSNTDLSEITPR